jgi:RNA polymerase sigma-70 factor (ECF subfamily)
MTHGPGGGELARIGHDPDAFETFYRQHLEAVQRFVARRVSDPHQAADLTADVFLAAIDSAGTFRPGRGTPIGWLYGVARNVLAATRRREARGLAAAGRLAARALVDSDDLARIEERIDAEAQARELYRAMERLTESERAVLELVALEQLSITDAAAALGIRQTAVRVRLHRARRAMRLHLDSTPAAEGFTPSEVIS